MTTAIDAHAVDDTEQREIERFLVEEASLLDARRYDEWLALLHDEFSYHVPVPLSREDSRSERYDDVMEYANESKSFLEMRFRRIKSDYAWAEHPAAYMRHFVTNFRVDCLDPRPGSTNPTWLTRTNVLLVRARLPEPPVMTSAERHDVIERAEGRLLLRRRDVYLDTEVPDDVQLGIIF
jgi:3-phenylpropionate/cinnamic acid dioxygenase small subunit